MDSTKLDARPRREVQAEHREDGELHPRPEQVGAAENQPQASQQRWVTARDSWEREDRSIEDHLFDYGSPADP